MIGAVVVAITILLLTGCTGNSARGGRLSEVADLHGQSYTIGGKEFDEQLVLCQLTVAALEAAGAAVTDRCNLDNTDAAREALVTGKIDLYWEYTGTGWINLLRNPTGIRDPEQQYLAVRDADLTKNHLMWLDPALAINNTYAFAVNQSDAQTLGVNTLSDMARILQRHPDEHTLCVDQELRGRLDGLLSLQRAYNFTVPDARTLTHDADAIYQETTYGGPCTFGLVFTTDGRIKNLNLRALSDDRKFFPYYNPAPVVRQSVFDRDPQIARVFDTMRPLLTFTAITELNARVSAAPAADHPDAARQVARAWLIDNQLISP